jgi:hypothetical protein
MKINAAATEQNPVRPEGRSSSLSVGSILNWWRLAEKVTLAVSERCITCDTDSEYVAGHHASCDVSASAFQVEVLLPPHNDLTHTTRGPIDSLDTRNIYGYIGPLQGLCSSMPRRGSIGYLWLALQTGILLWPTPLITGPSEYGKAGFSLSYDVREGMTHIQTRRHGPYLHSLLAQVDLLVPQPDHFLQCSVTLIFL